MEYLNFAKKEHSYRIVSGTITRLLRLHPTKAQVWIYAANTTFDENGDMTEARSHMQRGLRFCKSSKELWLAYARLELTYVWKLWKRVSILGTDKEQACSVRIEELDDNVLKLPAITPKDLEPEETKGSSTTKLQLDSVMNGAIPMAIFDSAHQQFQDLELAAKFFDLSFEFDDLRATKSFSTHVLSTMRSQDKQHPDVMLCYVREPVAGIPTHSPEFPNQLRASIHRLKRLLKDTVSTKFLHLLLLWCLSYITEDVDPDLHAVLGVIAKEAITQYKLAHETHRSGSGEEYAEMLRRVREAGFLKLIRPNLTWAAEIWPKDKAIAALDANRAENLLRTQS